MKNLKEEIFTTLDDIKKKVNQENELTKEDLQSLFLISLLEEEAAERPQQKGEH